MQMFYYAIGLLLLVIVVALCVRRMVWAATTRRIERETSRRKRAEKAAEEIFQRLLSITRERSRTPTSVVPEQVTARATNAWRTLAERAPSIRDEASLTAFLKEAQQILAQLNG
jgi:hypothetical protein